MIDLGSRCSSILWLLVHQLPISP
uniref:Uncharacterized protein n=1 Tax=Rhizophora mucronata TaxID=61149 RepID=A0A2P2NZ07_RHIMU